MWRIFKFYYIRSDGVAPRQGKVKYIKIKKSKKKQKRWRKTKQKSQLANSSKQKSKIEAGVVS